MLTITAHESEVSAWDAHVQNEIPLTDAEVSQRVMHIRSGWSVEERVQRRREAERRFAELINALADSAAA
jgi:hypothetical protein